MTNPLAIFKIKREERWLFAVALLVFASFNALLICSHWELYTKSLMHGGSWTLFNNNFEMSGYDQWSWLTLTEGRVDFETIRHPLYLTFLYPMYWLNHWLMSWSGINFAVIMLGIVITGCATYAAVFFHRICREVIELGNGESLLLTALLFSFAHVLVPCMVPDHFAITLSLLMLTLYVVGMRMKKGRQLKAWQGFLLAFFSGGMASTNVAKVYLAGLFANGRRFFKPRYLLVAVILPVLLLLAVQRIQYYTIEVPLTEKYDKIAKANAKKMDKAKMTAHEKIMQENNMKRVSDDKNSILYLFDFKTPRHQTLVDNYFGEGFQLHKEHLLGDVFKSRSVFVSYSFWGNYVVEAAIVLLFILGIIFGIRHKFYLLVLSWYGCDFLLNIVFGFAINEVYIMTSGWAFIIPIGVGYVFKRLKGHLLQAMQAVVTFLAVFLWAWNGSLIVSYLL